MKLNTSIDGKHNKHRRYLEIDFLRGVPILMMIHFHFTFDLDLLNMAHIPIFTNPLWLLYRETGVFMFMSVSGFCLYMEHHKGIRWQAFTKRFVKLMLAGALITIATYYYNPAKTIWLGILQFFAFASLLGLFFLRFGRLNLILGILIVGLGFIGNLNEAPNYMGPWFTWVGCGTMHMETFEIFPLVPFFGYYLIGMYMGKHLLEQKNDDYFLIKINSQNSAIRFTSFFGRHSLLIYLIHQPVLLGLLYLIKG